MLRSAIFCASCLRTRELPACPELLTVPPAAEIIKRRVPGIYQTTEISSITIVDVWEPKEEGLDTLETKRRVSVIGITLSKEPLDEDHIGFQPPLPADQVGLWGT